MRAETLRKVVYRGEAAKWREAPTRVEWQETIPGGPGYRIKKLRYEAVPGFWVPALLYEPEKLEGKVPAVLNFDGHDPEGMFADYKQVRCINLAKRGMIALNVDWIGMGQLKIARESAHACSITSTSAGPAASPSSTRSRPEASTSCSPTSTSTPARIAATGLSGGGWQTIFLGSIDPRVALTVPVAGYSSFLTRARFASDLGDSEQTPVDLATVTDYALMTAMLAPRAALLTFNAKDNCCFAADHALTPLLDAATPIYRLYGQEANLRTHVNHDPGTHNYLKDNRQALYRMLGDQFFPGQADYSAEEIPSDAEIKTVDQLRVALPPDQATLHSLAMALSQDLPRDPALPTEKPPPSPGRPPAGSSSPRSSDRTTTRSRPNRSGPRPRTGSAATFWKLRRRRPLDDPRRRARREASPKGTTILLADPGRKEARAARRRVARPRPASRGGRPLRRGRVEDRREGLALEPLRLDRRREAARPPGLAARRRGPMVASTAKGPVAILAVGPRSSTTALVAAGLEPQAIGDLELREAPGEPQGADRIRHPLRQGPRPLLLRPPGILRHPPARRPGRPSKGRPRRTRSPSVRRAIRPRPALTRPTRREDGAGHARQPADRISGRRSSRSGVHPPRPG